MDKIKEGDLIEYDHPANLRALGKIKFGEFKNPDLSKHYGFYIEFMEFVQEGLGDIDFPLYMNTIELYGTNFKIIT